MKINKETEAIIALLNQWGESKTAFVFLIDFECKKPLCWRLDENTATFKYDFNGFTNTKRIQNKNKTHQFEKYQQASKIIKTNLIK